MIIHVFFFFIKKTLKFSNNLKVFYIFNFHSSRVGGVYSNKNSVHTFIYASFSFSHTEIYNKPYAYSECACAKSITLSQVKGQPV